MYIFWLFGHQDLIQDLSYESSNPKIVLDKWFETYLSFGILTFRGLFLPLPKWIWCLFQWFLDFLEFLRVFSFYFLKFWKFQNNIWIHISTFWGSVLWKNIFVAYFNELLHFWNFNGSFFELSFWVFKILKSPGPHLEGSVIWPKLIWCIFRWILGCV